MKILLDKGAEAGLDMSSIQCASVGGEALPPSLRQALKELGVASVVQSYGTADLGLIAYESEAMEGMILDEGVIVEIVRRHVTDIHEGAVTTRPSKDGNYLAVTVTIEASSKQQLDAIYQDLSDHPLVLMAL